MAADLRLDEKPHLVEIRQPLAAEFNWTDFLSIGFSHHIEIIAKTKTLEARLFYIHECAIRYWSKYTLRDYLKADLYHHQGALPNNFAQTLPDTKQAIKAICSFKDEYLLDFINVEELNEQEEDLDEKIAVELKSGKFRSSYLGQLNTYLSALDSYVRKPHENPSIGIILCREMNQTFVEFAVRDYNKPMGVATYRASEEMPERLRKALPDIDELKKLL